MLDKLQEFEYKDISISSKKFDECSSNLLRSDYVTFRSHLSIFIDFCEKDKIMNFMISQLKDYDFIKWNNDFNSSIGPMGYVDTLHIPVSEDDRLSLIYQMLAKINLKEFDIDEFCIKIFTFENFDEQIKEFNDKMTGLLVRGLKCRLEEYKLKFDRIGKLRDIYIANQVGIQGSGTDVRDMVNSQWIRGNTSLNIEKLEKIGANYQWRYKFRVELLKGKYCTFGTYEAKLLSVNENKTMVIVEIATGGIPIKKILFGSGEWKFEEYGLEVTDISQDFVKLGMGELDIIRYHL